MSYDTPMPLVNPRKAMLCQSIDPLETDEPILWSTRRMVYDLVKFEARVVAKAGEHVLKDGNRVVDEHRFGKSVSDAIEYAQKLRQETSDGIDVTVEAFLTHQPVILAREEPFYMGCVKVHTTLPRWGWHRRDDGFIVEEIDLEPRVDEFLVWRNGEHTAQGVEVQHLIQTLPVQDALANSRKKPEER